MTNISPEERAEAKEMLKAMLRDKDFTLSSDLKQRGIRLTLKEATNQHDVAERLHHLGIPKDRIKPGVTPDSNLAYITIENIRQEELQLLEEIGLISQKGSLLFQSKLANSSSLAK